MQASQSGETVTLTMSAAEAQELEDELLWARDGDALSKTAWEALAALHTEEG
jgi:hypothetical protein